MGQEMTIDYRELLKRYMVVVDVVHGSHGLEEAEYEVEKCKLSENELEELYKLSHEGFEEYWSLNE